MTLTAWLQEELKQAFDKQGEAGLVVWYDQAGTLDKLVEERALPAGVRLLRFQGSYLALRFALEDEDPAFAGRWLIYVPEPVPRESWLWDYEQMGERLAMDLAELLRRRGLPLTGRLVDLLRNHPENARELAGSWDQLHIHVPLQEEEIVQALLALAFGLPGWQMSGALLKFAAGDGWQTKLGNRGLWEEWRGQVSRWMGWQEKDVPRDEGELRRRVRMTILLAELVKGAPALASRFPFLPSDAARREQAGELAKTWRLRSDLVHAYRDAAQAVEQELGLSELLTVAEPLVDAETVRCLDDLWLGEIRRAVSADGSNLVGKIGRIGEIAGRRKKLFWAGQEPAVRHIWEALEWSARLIQGCEQAENICQQCTRLEDFIARYRETWWELDLWALELAGMVNTLAGEDLDRFVRPAWLRYGDWLERVNRRFADAAEKEGWRPTQTNFWKGVIQGRRKTAVLFVDALRYDLACFLVERTKDEVNWSQEVMKACLPTITEVGMAALLPDAADQLGLTVEEGQLRVHLGTMPASTRQERRQVLEGHLGKKGKVISLDEVKDADLRKAETVIVLSREVDQMGSFAADIFPEGLLRLTDQIVSAIRSLTEQGFTQFLITADHGFLFLPPGVVLQRVPAPPALLCQRRFAIGAAPEGCLTITAEQEGLAGGLLISFPKGLAVFALQGELGAFLHGGFTLQEALIPLLKGHVKKTVGRKIEVSMDVPEKLTSRLAKVTLRAIPPDLFAEPRRVKVSILGKCSDLAEFSEEGERSVTIAWLDEFDQPPEEAQICLLDADTEQILACKTVPVELIM